MSGFRNIKSKPRCKNHFKSSDHKYSQHINNLPNEVLAEIFVYLSVEDLALNVKFVCNHWNEVLEEPKIWSDKTFVPTRKSKTQYIIQVIKNSPKLENFCLPKPICFSKPIVQTLVKYCTNIKRLNLSVYHTEYVEVHELLDCLSDTLLYLVLDIKPNHLMTEGTEFIDKFMFAIVNCTKLNGLTLSGTMVLRAPQLILLASSFPYLLHLDLTGVCIFDSPGWETFLQIKGEKLLSLSFSWIYMIRDTLFSVPAKYCPILEKLSVRPRMVSISNARYKEVPFKPLEMMVKLKDLSIISLDILFWNDLIDTLESGCLINLERLNLSKLQCEGGRLLQAIFNGCYQLRYLTLQQCNNLTDASLHSIYLLNRLIHLDLSGCRGLGNAAVVHIVECSTLEYLCLNDCPRITTRSVILCIENLKYLKELNMNMCSFRPRWPIPNQLRNTLHVRECRMRRPVRHTYKALRKRRD